MSTTEKGDAGKSRISANLSFAIQANVRDGSYSEDSLKCDILFTFKNAFDSSELCEFAGQAKTGESYYTVDPKQKTVRIDNCSDVKAALAKVGIPIIIFVVSNGKEIYWYATDLRSKSIKTIKLPQTQIILPSIWIDFSRMYRYWQYQSNKYLTQTMSVKTFDKTFIKSSKDVFKKLLSNKIKNPITGDITISRKAWEHVTRKSKTKNSRHMAIRAVSHLGHFVSKNPDRMVLKNVTREEKKELIYEKRELVFYFRKGISFNNLEYTFALRIDELIIFPKDWTEKTLISSDFQHKRKIASWWVKKNTY